MGRVAWAIGVLLLVAAQGVKAQGLQDNHVDTINQRTQAIAHRNYPPSLRNIEIPDSVQRWLEAELVDAGDGAERAYCAFGKWVNIDVIQLDRIERSVELVANTNRIVTIPCPPEALGRAHLHTRAAGESTCWWSVPDASSFKNRVIVFGTVFLIDLVVCWEQGQPTVKAYGWGDLAIWETKPAEPHGVPPVFSVRTHQYLRAVFRNVFSLDVDTLYVGRWP